jgi:uncharacterized protein YlxP (DUF503 family)
VGVVTSYIPLTNNVDTPKKMCYILFDCPEWKGSKKTSLRPGIVRNLTEEKMIVYPLTSKYHYREELGIVEVTELDKYSWVVMKEVAVLNLKRVKRVLGDVSDEVRNQIDYWEERMSDLILSKEAKLGLA